MKTNYHRSNSGGPATSIAATINDASSLSSCARLLARAELTELLGGVENFTFFAPTDAAFESLPPETLKEIVDDRARLRAVLEYHILPGRWVRTAFADRKLKTLEGTLLTVGITDDGLMLDHACTSGREIVCSNGVIHPIDAVLVPGFKPTLSAKALEVSAWTGRPAARPQPPPREDWPFHEPKSTE